MEKESIYPSRKTYSELLQDKQIFIDNWEKNNLPKNFSTQEEKNQKFINDLREFYLNVKDKYGIHEKFIENELS